MQQRISVLAFTASCVSAAYVRQQANSQREVTALERDRRKGERTPRFELEIKDVNNDFTYFRLWLTLASTEPLDSVTVELPTQSIIQFVEDVAGVRDPATASSWQRLTVGQRVAWRVRIADGAKENETVLVHCTTGTDRWATRVPVAIPATNLGTF